MLFLRFTINDRSCSQQNFAPEGLTAFYLRVIHKLEIMKNSVKKSEMEIIFPRLIKMIWLADAFFYHKKKYCGLFICIRSWKILFKVRHEGCPPEIYNKWSQWYRLPVTITILFPRYYLPLTNSEYTYENHDNIFFYYLRWVWSEVFNEWHAYMLSKTVPQVICLCSDGC